jgi:transcriptional regulator with XRE-family HTH domain
MSEQLDRDKTTARARIRALLDHLEINQSEFAADLEISHSYVSSILSGSRAASTKLIRAIKKKYFVLDSWWETGEGSISEENNFEIHKRLDAQRKFKAQQEFVENYVTPEFMTIINNLDDVLESVDLETRYAAVTLLNRYIKNSLVDDVHNFLEKQENRA